MDRRNEELRYLRKAYRRERRNATGAWKFFFAICFPLCLVMAPGCLFLLLPDSNVTKAVLQTIEGTLGFFGAGNPYTVVPVYPELFWIILFIVALVLFVSVIMWIVGSRKLRRNDAFLSYKTLRAALRDEAAQN